MTEGEYDDLSGAEAAIVDALAEHGNMTKGALVDATGYSRNTVYTRLEVLQAAGFVDCVHDPTRLFTLVEDPRPTTEFEPFVRSRLAFDGREPADLAAFATALVTDDGDVEIHLDAPSGAAGVHRQCDLMAIHMRALAWLVGVSVGDVAETVADRATDVDFGDIDEQNVGFTAPGE